MDKPAENLAIALGNAIQAGMDHAGSIPAKEAVKVRPHDWHRIVDLGREAAALLQSLSADNARLREERDGHKGLHELADLVLHGFKERAESAEARLSEAVEVLKPFAEASANLDDSHSDGSPIWESPAAMGIDAKHLRAAQSFLDTQGGGNG